MCLQGYPGITKLIRDAYDAGMRYAIAIPQLYADGSFSPDDFRSYFARVEELGVYESAWTQESPLGSSPQLAPLEVMTYAAACTTSLRLGCTVFVTTLHSPVHLAKSIASLDQMSGGRVEVGVGSGGPRRPFAAFGFSGDRYVARFTEGLALMKELWTSSSVTFDGEFFQLSGAQMEPKPFQKPYPGCGSAGRPRPPCGAVFGCATRSSARGRLRPGRSRRRWPWCATRSRWPGGPPGSSPAGSRSPSGSTSASTRRRRPGAARMNDALAAHYGQREPAIEAAAWRARLPSAWPGCAT